MDQVTVPPWGGGVDGGGGGLDKAAIKGMFGILHIAPFPLQQRTRKMQKQHPMRFGQAWLKKRSASSCGREEARAVQGFPQSPIMWTAMEGVGDHGTPIPVR